jgi:hypothetical protein
MKVGCCRSIVGKGFDGMRMGDLMGSRRIARRGFQGVSIYKMSAHERTDIRH